MIEFFDWKQVLLFSDLETVVDANDIGCSEPPGKTCDNTVPNPYGNEMAGLKKSFMDIN